MIESGLYKTIPIHPRPGKTFGFWYFDGSHWFERGRREEKWRRTTDDWIEDKDRTLFDHQRNDSLLLFSRMSNGILQVVELASSCPLEFLVLTGKHFEEPKI